MKQQFEKIKSINGELFLRGDKSISHRSVMFAAMANGNSVIKNCSSSEDVHSTIKCFEQLGASFKIEDDVIYVSGKGFKGFKKPEKDLYAGNSGTTARLISGILCAQDFESVITGDESLSKRPMKRIVEPLRLMGADIYGDQNGMLPLRISPAKLHSVNYELQVASAQVKSAILLAALHLEDETKITEVIPTRNHTEKLLELKTLKTIEGTDIFISKKNYPDKFEITVPSDISSAAFFIVLTLILKDSQLIIKNVSLNETRTGILEILKRMGGKIETQNVKEEKGEKVGDLLVTSSYLMNVSIPKEIIPNIIDEIPILSIAGIFAEGEFKISNAKELRVKESDRIKSLCNNFIKAGIRVTEYVDGFTLSGNLTKESIEFESYGDHRIAMAFAVLSMMMNNGGSVNNFESVEISNPQFLNQLNSLSSK